MAGWWDSVFGPPPQPAHPASRGALLGMGGYQNMPDMTAGIEDRRNAPAVPPLSTRPHDRDVWSINKYNPFGQRYDMDQWSWLQKNLPENLPMAQPQDAGAIVDPSVMARIKAAQAAGQAAHDAGGGWIDPQQGNLPTPMPNPPDPRRGPQLADIPGMTLNSNPWGQ